MFSWLHVSPLVGQQVLIVRFIVSMLLLCVSIMHFFMFLRACIAFFPWWKKQTNGKLLSAGWLSGSSGGEGGREGGVRDAERESCYSSAWEEEEEERGGEMCHVLPVTPFTSSASSGMEVLPAASCSQIKWSITSCALRLSFARTSARLPGPICGSFWFCFFFLLILFPVFHSITYVDFLGGVCRFSGGQVRDFHLLSTRYCAFWLWVDVSLMSKTCTGL